MFPLIAAQLAMSVLPSLLGGGQQQPAPQEQQAPDPLKLLGDILM